MTNRSVLTKIQIPVIKSESFIFTNKNKKRFIMKRILIFLLALVMCLSLAACSGSSGSSNSNSNNNADDSIDNDQSEVVESSNVSENESSTSNDFSENEISKDETVSQEESDTVSDEVSQEASSDVPEEDILPDFGSTERNIYKNASIGIKCELDSSWTFRTDEEIKEMNGFAAGMMPEEYADALKNNESIYDMYAVNEASENIVVTFSPSPYSSLIGIEMENYAKICGDQLVELYASMGGNATYKVGTTTIGTKTYTCLDLDVTLYGVQMYQKVILTTTKGYVVQMNITAFSKENLKLYESCFSAI